MTFFIEQRPLMLPPAQFRLLSHLYQHVPMVCTRESCAEAIWGREYDPTLDTKALDQALTKLRNILRDADPTAAELLRTHRGQGYILLP